MKCPRCNSIMLPATALNEGLSKWWFECSNNKCNTFYNSYKPQEHQAEFHADDHRFVGNFGGYGSGKTLTSQEETYKHIFITPAGRTLIGANVQSQYEQTLKVDIESDIPKAFVKGVSTQKQYIDFINGHRLLFRPYDDVDKLRSYNLTSFVILEASEVKREAFTQLKTRLRNLAATVPVVDEDGKPIVKIAKNGVEIPEIAYNWTKGIIESNPDAGWIRSDLLFVSDVVSKHGKVTDAYELLIELQDKNIACHVTATDANEFLPPGFIEQNTRNKPAWWTQRYIHGSFVYAEGLVYPSAYKSFVKDYDIPVEWKRIIAYDYGLSDPSVFLLGAIDEKRGKLVLYNEAVEDNKNIEELAALFHSVTKDIPIGGLVCPPIIDPKSGPKRDYDKKTLSDHFLDYGIAFKPGHVNVDARVFRLNTYLESGKIEIMESCRRLREEIKNYKFRADEDQTSGYTGKPEDRNNHSINCLEWITMELAADPRNLVYGIYDKMGRDLTQLKEPEEQMQIYALSDDSDDYSRETAFDMVDYNFGF